MVAPTTTDGPGPISPPALKRRWARGLVIATLVALIGLGIYSAVAFSLLPAYHYRQAQQALERRQLDAAQEHIAACLRARPLSVPTRLLAARIARLRGAYDDAEDHLRRCRELEGSPSEAVQLEGFLIRGQRGFFGDGVEEYLQNFVAGQLDIRPQAPAKAPADPPPPAAEGPRPLPLKGPLHPETPAVLEALAEGYYKNYRLQQAMYCAELWLRFYPDSVNALAFRGKLYDRLSMHHAAADDYRAVLKADPERDDVRLYLAMIVLTDLRNPKEAYEELEKVHRRDPNRPDILLGMARCLRTLGQVAEAKELLDRVVALGHQNPLVFLEKGEIALHEADEAGAEQMFRQAVTLDPYSATANMSLSRLLHQHNKIEEAVKFEKEWRRLNADQSRAMQIMTRELPRSPNDANLRYEMGLINRNAGKMDEAVRWFLTAVQEDPRHGPAHMALAQYYSYVGRQAEADHHLSQAEAAGIPAKQPPAPPAPGTPAAPEKR